MSISAISSINSAYGDSARYNLSKLNAASLQEQPNTSPLSQQQAEISGVHSPVSNPQATIRVDQNVLQAALNAGDLHGAQRACAQLLQDQQAITAAANAPQLMLKNPAASAMPNPDSASDGSEEQGQGLSVYA